MAAQIKKLQEQMGYPPSPSKLHKIESTGLIRPQDFAIKQRGTIGNIGHNRGPAIKPGSLKRMNSTHAEVSLSSKAVTAGKEIGGQFDYDSQLKDFQDSVLQAPKVEKPNKVLSPPKQLGTGRDGKVFSFKLLTPSPLKPVEKDLSSGSRVVMGPASPTSSKVSLVSSGSGAFSKLSSPYLGASTSGTRQPIRSPSRTSFRLRDSSGSIQPRLDRSGDRPEVSHSDSRHAPSDSLGGLRSPKERGFSIKKQLSSMFSGERTKLYSSSPLASNLTSQANLPVLQQSNEPKVVFKHDTCSMTGYSQESEKVNQDYAKSHSFHIGQEKKEIVKLFAIGDGHGMNGSLASKLAVDTLASLIEKKLNRAETTLSQSEQADSEQKFIKETTQVLEESFSEAHQLLKQDTDRRFRYSGTTLVCVLYRRNVFYFCNVGDSKGILCSRGTNPKDIVCSFETAMHKPDDPQEKERITSAGGLVIESIDQDTGEINGPPRVWNKTKTEPGLATSRSIGDIVAHNLGVSHVPGSTVSNLRHHNEKSRPDDRQDDNPCF